MNIVLMNPRLHALKAEGVADPNDSIIHNLVETVSPSAADIILLPEHHTFEGDPELYRGALRELAARSGAYVIGGSHHEQVGAKTLNTGIAIDPTGKTLGSYSKLRPYSQERKFVSPGEHVAEFTVGGIRVMVLICADFWFSDLIQQAKVLPDVLIVPALSVSRKKEPFYARSLWRNLAISRAYEFGVYVAISDWSEDSVLPKYRTCGVGGFADPTTTDPDYFFQPVGEAGILRFTIDLDALEKFRADRRERGFFWK